MLSSGIAPPSADLRQADDIIVMPRKFIKKLVFFVLFACSAVALYLVLFASHKGNVNAEWNAIIEKLKFEAASKESAYGREDRRRTGEEFNNEGNVGPPPLRVDSVADNGRRYPKRPAKVKHEEEYDYDVEREVERDEQPRRRVNAPREGRGRFRGELDRDNNNGGDERERQDVIVDRLDDVEGDPEVVDRVKAERLKTHPTVPREYLITNDVGEVIGEKLFAGGINHLLQKRPLVDGVKRREDLDNGGGPSEVRERVREGDRSPDDLLQSAAAAADGHINLNKNLNDIQPDAPHTPAQFALDQNRVLARIPNAPAGLNDQVKYVINEPGNKMAAVGIVGAADRKWEEQPLGNGNIVDNNNNNNVLNNKGFVQDANVNLPANNANVDNGPKNEQIQQNRENPVDMKGIPQQGLGANEQRPEQNELGGNIDPQVKQQQQQQQPEIDQLLQKLKDLPPEMQAAILKQRQDMIMQGQGRGLQQPDVNDVQPQIPAKVIEQEQPKPNDDPQILNPEVQNQIAMNLKNLPPNILAKIVKQQQDGLQQAQNPPIEQLGNDAQLRQQRDNVEQTDQNQPAPKPAAKQEHLFIEDLSMPLPIHVDCVPFSFPSGSAPLCIHQGDKDPDMSAKIATNGSYEKDIMDQFTHILLSDPTLGFIDIGAGIGVYTIAAALLNREVLSVEPLFRNYRLIHKSALENNVFSKIVLVTMALDNESYVGHMSYTDTGGYSNVLITKLSQDMIQDRPNVVHVTTLNDLVQAVKSKRALMKLDVSDWLEVRILQAADSFFNAVTVPYIITHWSRSAEPDKHVALYNKLTGLGYQPKQAWNGAVVNKDYLSNDVSYIVWSQ